MKIVYNKIIPFPGFLAINLFGILFVRERVILTDEIINHERIHTAQIKELLYLFFYLFYFLEWIFRLFQFGFTKESYYNISFEREAYANQANGIYLKFRTKYAFINYLKQNKK